MILKHRLLSAVSAAAAISLLTASVPVCAEETASAAFEELADRFYWGILELAPSNLHFYQSSLENVPFDLSNPLGSFSEEAEEERIFIQNMSEGLDAIAYDELDSHQKKVYHTMKYFIDIENASLALPDYYATLGPMGGLLSNTDTIISEYYLLCEEDIENYLALLNDIPRFLDDVLLELNYQESLGFSPSSYCYECALEKEEDLVTLDNHPYLNTFLDNIQEAGLSEDSVAAYQEQVNSILSDTVIPAYEAFFDVLEEKSETAGESRGLCSYDQGKDYYAALAQMNTGCDMSPDELYDYLQTRMAQDLGNMSRIYFSNPSAMDAAEALPVPSTDPEEILEMLREKALENFPSIDNTQFLLSYLPEALQIENTLAYYISPPSDLQSRNVIRVNGDAVGDDPATLWTTLSHEGFPGHLYQTQYLNQYVSTYPVEALLSSLGTTEGWAFYVERLSLDWAQADPDAADIYWYNTTINMALTALIDIGVNYNGWTTADLSSFLSNYLEAVSEEDCQNLYDTVASDPGAYLPYAVGYYQMVDLFESIRGNYSSDKEMYTAFLDLSWLPFTLLHQYLGTDGSI